MTSENF